MGAPEMVHPTLTVLGCGKMGTSIVTGLVEALRDPQSTDASYFEALPRHINACVRSDSSAARLSAQFDGAPVEVTQSWREAVNTSDVVLLATKPADVPAILQDPAFREAIRGKLLLSICVGLFAPKIQLLLGDKPSDAEPTCAVRCVAPNIASSIRKSATLICTSPEIPQAMDDLTTNLFDIVGRTIPVSDAEWGPGSILAVATPAFMALFCQGLVDGAVEEGLKPAAAEQILACALDGASSLMAGSMQPSEIVAGVSSIGAPSEMGLSVLKQRRMQDAAASSVTAATARLSHLL